MRSWLVLVMLNTACLESSSETQRVRQALGLQVTVTDFAAGTFEGGVEQRELRLAVSPPASGVTPERVDSLDVPRAGHTAAVARGFIYVLGGDGLASTSRARLDDAALGPFIAQTPLPAPRANAAATSLGDRLFLAGGSGAADVWHAPVGADGNLGAWASTTPLPQPLEQHAMVAARGRLYVLGGVGATGPSAQTWRAEVQPDGTLSAWVPDTSLPFPRAGAGVVLLGDRLVVLGGSSQLSPRVDVADVVSARIEADGRLGPFRAERPLPRARGFVGAVAGRQALVVVSGFGSSEVWFAPVQAQGTLGAWSVASTLPAETGAAAAVGQGRWVVLLGGRSSTSLAPTTRVQRFSLDEGPTLTPFSVRGMPLSTSISEGAVVATRSTLFMVGGAEAGIAVDTVRRWEVRPGTLTGPTLSTLPRSLRQAAAVARHTELYAIGGRTAAGVLSDEVLATTWNENGTLTPWTVRARLPTARARVGATIEGDQLFVVGGDDGAQVSDVLTATFLADGGLSAFVLAGQLPMARAGVAVSSKPGRLLVAGGEEAPGMARAEVLTASLGPGGMLGPWSAAVPLASPRTGAVALAHAGRVLLVGGTTTGADEVVAARWSRDGQVTPFEPVGALPQRRVGLGAAVVGDELFVLGGSGALDVLSARSSTMAAPGAFVAGPSVPSARRASRLVSTSSHAYLIGGSGPGGDFPDVLVAARQPDDSLGPWVPSTPLPQSRYLHVPLISRNRLLVLGGTTGMGATNDALTAPLFDDGGVGPWTTTTPLPNAGNEAAGVVLGDFLYVTGGQAGVASTAVLVSKVLADGGLSPWQATTPLPRARWAHAAVTLGNRVVVAGGTPDDIGSPEAIFDVVAADAQPDGGLGPWQRIGTMSTARRNFALLASSGVLLAVGGSTAGVGTRLDDVEAAPVLEDGTLGPFVTVGRFPTARRHPVAALVGDRLFVGTGVGPPIQTHYADGWLAPLALPRAVGAWSTLVDLGPAARTVEAFQLRTIGAGRLRVESAVVGLDGGFEPAVSYGEVASGGRVVLSRPGRGLRVSVLMDESSAFARGDGGGAFILEALVIEGSAEDAGVPAEGDAGAAEEDAGVTTEEDGGVPDAPSDGGSERPGTRRYAVGCGCGSTDAVLMLTWVLALAALRRRSR